MAFEDEGMELAEVEPVEQLKGREMGLRLAITVQERSNIEKICSVRKRRSERTIQIGEKERGER